MPDITRSVHRFRAFDHEGILGLAKDVTRLIVDRIDIASLRTIVVPPKGEDWRSIKSLERALATLVDSRTARSMLAPLAGVYELRIGSAHLPSSEIAEAFELIGINPDDAEYDQAMTLLVAVAGTLWTIDDVIKRGLKAAAP